MRDAWVVRVRYVDNGPDQPGGVGWLTKEGWVTHSEGDAQRYASEADAWLHATMTDKVGSDEDGDWCWVESAA